MESAIRIAVLLLVLGLGVRAVARSDDRLVMLFAALGGLTYFSYNVGFVLSPDKLIGLLSFLWILLNQRKLGLIGNSYVLPFFFYATYLFYLTLAMSIAWPDASVSNQSFLYSSTMRGFVQLFQLVMAFLIVLIVVDRIKTPEQIRMVLTVLLVSYILLCLYGLYVWFAQQVGLPFNPISRQGRSDATLGHIIRERINGVYVVRAYSLTGEPKALALNASFAFVLLYFTPARNWWKLHTPLVQSVVGVLFLVTLFLTLSTSGYILLPLFVLAALLAQALAGVGNIRVMKQGAVLLLLGALAAVIFEIDVIGRLSNMIEARITSRLSESANATTYADEAILNFWADQPFYMLSGVGLGGSSFYVRLYDTSAYAGYTAAPRGLIGFLSDQGLIGLLLYLFAFAKCAGIILRAARRPGPHRSLYAGILVVIACGLIMQFTITMWYLTWLTMALAIVTARAAGRELKGGPGTFSNPDPSIKQTARFRRPIPQ